MCIYIYIYSCCSVVTLLTKDMLLKIIQMPRGVKREGGSSVQYIYFRETITYNMIK